jgi:NAD(P)-dependent dehydrogenase (short-subunit alcohol dehydrogenase family)
VSPGVVVTGGAGGIGQAIVRVLAGRDWAVTAVDRAGCGDVAGAATVEEADLGSAEDCTRVVQAAGSELGGLVHCAGIRRDAVTWKLKPEDWRAVLSVNLDAAFHLCRAAVPVLRERGEGSIVLVSSINGERGRFGQSAYAASKAGLHGLAKSLAREVGRFGIRVNCVAPGMIETQMTETLPESVLESSRAETCLGRLGTPEDVAEVVAFLLSSASRHVTGQVLRVDGGQLT